MNEFLTDLWAVVFALRWLIVLAAFALLGLLFAEERADNNHLRSERKRLAAENHQLRRRLNPIDARRLLVETRARAARGQR